LSEGAVVAHRGGSAGDGGGVEQVVDGDIDEFGVAEMVFAVC